MSAHRPQRDRHNLIVATGWVAVAFATVTVIGLRLAPSMRMVWIVLLVLAVVALPQAVLIGRRSGRS
jgi:hypothetical protein